MPSAIRRRTPEELLQQLQAEEDYERRGRLKVFLGYASGVGKSFRMLDEGRRRSGRGQDVVVGAIQAKTPPDIEAVLKKLEVIPPREVDTRAFAWWTDWPTTTRPDRPTPAAGRM